MAEMAVRVLGRSGRWRERLRARPRGRGCKMEGETRGSRRSFASCFVASSTLLIFFVRVLPISGSTLLSHARSPSPHSYHTLSRGRERAWCAYISSPTPSITLVWLALSLFPRPHLVATRGSCACIVLFQIHRFLTLPVVRGLLAPPLPYLPPSLLHPCPPPTPHPHPPPPSSRHPVGVASSILLKLLQPRSCPIPSPRSSPFPGFF